MSYMNNDDYVRLSRIEEYQTELKNAKFDLTKVLVAENGDDTGYDDLWGNGIKMNWNLVPLEEQKCHINWRQAIDDDGSGLGKLGSWQDQGVGTSTGYGVNGTSNNEQKVDIYIENQKDMNAKKGEFSEWVEPAIQIVDQKAGTALVDCANNLNDIKNKIGSGTDIDAAAVLAAGVAIGTEDYDSIISKYRSIQTALGSEGGANPALVWTAYGTEEGMVKRYIDGTLEDWVNSNSSDNDDDDTVAPTVKTIEAPTIVNGGFAQNSGKSGQGVVSQSSIRQIVVHHTACNELAGESAEKRIEQMKSPLFHSYVSSDSCDYHYVVYPDGMIISGCPDNCVAGHAADNNTNTIGIAIAGNYSTEVGKDLGNPITLSSAAEKSMISLIAKLMSEHSLEPIRSGSPQQSTLIGHTESYGSQLGVISSDTVCPSQQILNKLDSWVTSVKSGHLTDISKMWTDFVRLIEKGLKKQGTTSTDGLGLFPKICFLYVNILSHQQTSQSDGGEWGFPFSDDDMRNLAPGKGAYVTGAYGEWRSYYNNNAGGKHEGVDLQPCGLALNPGEYSSHHFPVRAMKDGTAFYQPDYCNGVMIVHNDGTCSRYLHMQNIAISDGQRVQKGDKLGEVSGASSASNMTAYPYHLHVEMMRGTSADAKIGSTDQSIGIDPVSKWNNTNYTAGADGVIGKYSV